MGGTVVVTAGDRDGMMVSLLQSNFVGFGSGVVVPDTGISLHNRAGSFTFKPGPSERAGAGASGRCTRCCCPRWCSRVARR